MEVSNIARCSSKTNELRDIDSIWCRARNITITITCHIPWHTYVAEKWSVLSLLYIGHCIHSDQWLSIIAPAYQFKLSVWLWTKMFPNCLLKCPKELSQKMCRRNCSVAKLSWFPPVFWVSWANQTARVWSSILISLLNVMALRAFDFEPIEAIEVKKRQNFKLLWSDWLRVTQVCVYFSSRNIHLLSQ